MTRRGETTTRAGERVEYVDRSEGPVAAALLAAGAGAFALGVLTTRAEASASIKDFLNFYNRVGPLSGKTILAVVVWLVSWIVLHMAYRTKEIESRKVLAALLLLIGLGILGTFPIFFQAFAPAE